MEILERLGIWSEQNEFEEEYKYFLGVKESPLARSDLRRTLRKKLAVDTF